MIVFLELSLLFQMSDSCLVKNVISQDYAQWSWVRLTYIHFLVNWYYMQEGENKQVFSCGVCINNMLKILITCISRIATNGQCVIGGLITDFKTFKESVSLVTIPVFQVNP